MVGSLPPEAHAHEPRPRRGEIVHGMLAHERAARVGRGAVAQPAEDRAYGLIHRLALEVPARHVDGGEREGEDAAGTSAARGAPDLGHDSLDLGRVVAHHEIREGIDGSLQGRSEGAAEKGEAHTNQALVRAELQRDELARVGGLGQTDHQGIVGRRAQDPRGDVGDLHRRNLSWSRGVRRRGSP